VKHELKCWARYFDQVWEGRKLFELRRNDRGFRVGDELLLVETELEEPTGREITATVTSMVVGPPWLAHGVAALGIRVDRRLDGYVGPGAGRIGVGEV